MGIMKNKFLKLLGLTGMSILLAACGGDGNEDDVSEEVRPGHLITGEIANADGKDAVLLVFEEKKERVIDSVKIVNGKFEFETPNKELREYILIIGEQQMPIVLFLDESSDVVEIEGSYPEIGDNYTVSGSEISQDVKDYLTFLSPFFPIERDFNNQMRSLAPNDTVRFNEILTKWDSVSAIQKEYAIDYINEKPSSPVSWLMLKELFPPGGLEYFDTTDFKYFNQVANEMRAKYPYSEYPDLIESDLTSFRSQLELMNQPPLAEGYGTEVGDLAPEIALPNENGQEMTLSSLQGDVVLLDFWASWCGPCRKENPNVVRLYNEYNEKGFTVFSVSLDESREPWIKAIEADNLSWPNHVSDLNGWQSPAAALYGVNAIPATFLLDAEGRIIAKNLRGVQLEQKLQEILG